jgi:hypothetical protein
VYKTSTLIILAKYCKESDLIVVCQKSGEIALVSRFRLIYYALLLNAGLRPNKVRIVAS